MVTHAIIPVPRVDVSVRVATLADIPFMDSLQKANNKALGHFPTKQFEGYVEMGAVLVAQTAAAGPLPGPLPGEREKDSGTSFIGIGISSATSWA
jgi:hypothetical protein